MFGQIIEYFHFHIIAIFLSSHCLQIGVVDEVDGPMPLKEGGKENSDWPDLHPHLP